MATFLLFICGFMPRGAPVAWSADWFAKEERRQVQLCAETKAKPAPKFRIILPDAASAIAYSPDGRRLAVGIGSQDVHVFNVATGKLEFKIWGFDDPLPDAWLQPQNASLVSISAIAFSSDGRRLAIGHRAGFTKIFAMPGSKKSKDLRPDDAAEDLGITHGELIDLAFSPDGCQLATCGRPVQNGPVRRLRIPNSGLLKLWDSQTGQLVEEFVDAHTSQVWSVDFANDGTLASGGYLSRTAKSSAGVNTWTIKKDSELLVMKDATFATPADLIRGSTPKCVRFSNDGQRLALGLWCYERDVAKVSGAITVFDIGTGDHHSWKVPKSADQIQFNSNDQYLAALTRQNELTLFDPSSGKAKSKLVAFGDPNSVRWRTFAISPVENTIAISVIDSKHRHYIEFWDVEDKETVEPD